MNHLPRSIPAALRMAAVCLLAASALPGGAFALGLGEIVVKSSYSKGFVAEIPVFLDQGETELKAVVGTQVDYNMIQIGRPPFVDGLSVTVENGAAGKVVVIRSKDPITQPSFNLVIRATASGGTVLENYFLAVDFRKSLSLDLPPPEEHVAEAPKPEKKAAHAPGPLPVPAPVPAPVPVPAPAPAPAPAAESAPAPMPSPVITPAPEPVVQAAVPPPPVAEPPAAAEPPAKIPSRPATPDLAKLDANPSKNRVKVKRGDTLFSIARTLSPSPRNLPRLVVAIYMENKDAFIDGNIHLLRANATLDYRHVNERAEGITDEEARQLLSDDWKDRQKKDSTEPAVAASVDLPFEKPPSEQEAADFLEQWRKDWVANAPGLDDRYANSFHGYRGHLRADATKAEWLASRRAFNNLHDNITVAVSDIKTSPTGVTFTQTFTSDQFFSVGKKSLGLARENGELRITEERFTATRAIDRTHSWTVLFPSVQSREMAVARVQKVRGLDANVYNAGGMPSGPFLMAAGRFTTRAFAEDFQGKLKSAGEQEAKVVVLPFSVRMKTTEDPAVAAAAMAELAERDYFPFKVETVTAEGKTRYIVCLGAFATRAEAVKACDVLKVEGFKPQPVIP